MRLNEIQKHLTDVILDVPSRLETVENRIFRAGKIPLQERLKVYRNNVMGNVGKALMANFPLTEKLVGREFLNSMVRAYILAHPPQSGCLTFYGVDFGDFAGDYAPAKDLAYLADMLRLEILINRAYHAKDDAALLAQDMTGDDLEQFDLKTRDSVHVLQSKWPLHKIRAFCLDETLPAPDVQSGGGCLLIHRQGLDVEVTEISAGEYAFLQNTQTKTLGQSVADTMADHPDFDFQNALPRFMNWQIFLKTEMAS